MSELSEWTRIRYYDLTSEKIIASPCALCYNHMMPVDEYHMADWEVTICPECYNVYEMAGDDETGIVPEFQIPRPVVWKGDPDTVRLMRYRAAKEEFMTWLMALSYKTRTPRYWRDAPRTASYVYQTWKKMARIRAEGEIHG